jgi:hypothetical protein
MTTLPTPADLRYVTDEELARLAGWIQTERARRRIEADATGQVVTREQPDHTGPERCDRLMLTSIGYLHYEPVRCRDAPCPGCDDGHGWGWYAYARRGEHLTSDYVGEALPGVVRLEPYPDTTTHPGTPQGQPTLPTNGAKPEHTSTGQQTTRRASSTTSEPGNRGSHARTRRGSPSRDR